MSVEKCLDCPNYTALLAQRDHEQDRIDLLTQEGLKNAGLKSQVARMHFEQAALLEARRDEKIISTEAQRLVCDEVNCIFLDNTKEQ